MILVDSSVWISHFRYGNTALPELLDAALVLVHPFVISELACGSLKNRRQILAYLTAVPFAVEASNDEALRLIDAHKLWGQGLGWIDVHLIASALLSKCRLYTLDQNLEKIAEHAGISTYRASR